MPVLDHVSHAGRRASIIFQHPERAGFIADDIGAADMHVGVEGNVEADHRLAIAGILQDQLGRHDLIGEDFPLVVDVIQEHVQRAHALHDAGFDLVPLGRGDHPRDQVERQNPVDRGGIGIHREGDAAFQQVPLRLRRPLPQTLDRQRRQPRHQQRQGRMLRLAWPKHFAEKRIGIVTLHRPVGLQLRLQLALDLSLARTTRRHSRLRFAMRHDKQNRRAGKDFPQFPARREMPLFSNAFARYWQTLFAGGCLG